VTKDLFSKNFEHRRRLKKMLYPYLEEKMANARLDAMIEEARANARARELGPKRSFRLPKLSSLFSKEKSEQKTAVATQAR
jgi:hypothetical protein